MSDYNFNLPPPWFFILVGLLAIFGAIVICVSVTVFLMRHIHFV